jgi:hypothetical protein
MLGNFVTVDEIKVYTKRTDVRRLLYDVLFLLITNALDVELVELIFVIVGDEILAPLEGCVCPYPVALVVVQELL